MQETQLQVDFICTHKLRLTWLIRRSDGYHSGETCGIFMPGYKMHIVDEASVTEEIITVSVKITFTFSFRSQ